MSAFDYDSIMMYGSTAFSDDGQKTTMLPKVANVILTDVWLKSGASHSDIYNINTLYSCLPKYDEQQ
ncbi:meprin A subunit beta-like protein, partial [Leptotrombidium deliense]